MKLALMQLMNSAAQMCARLLWADLTLILHLALSLALTLVLVLAVLADPRKGGQDHLLPALLVRGRRGRGRGLIARLSPLAASIWVLRRPPRRRGSLGLIGGHERLGRRGLLAGHGIGGERGGRRLGLVGGKRAWACGAS